MTQRLIETRINVTAVVPNIRNKYDFRRKLIVITKGCPNFKEVAVFNWTLKTDTACFPNRWQSHYQQAEQLIYIWERNVIELETVRTGNAMAYLV
jgi:hypothetical protein